MIQFNKTIKRDIDLFNKIYLYLYFKCRKLPALCEISFFKSTGSMLN